MIFTISDIVKNKLCVGCGVCTSESNSKMKWNQEGFLIPDLDSSFNAEAIKLCPFNPNPDKDVYNETVIAGSVFPNSKIDQKIGRYKDNYIGYSIKHRESSSSGGIATFVFEQLLRRNIIDHLFIVKEVNGSYEYQWFDDYEDISKISKTRYLPVTLETLFKEIDNKKGKVAVSGVGCFIKAIRLKQYYKPEYKDKIPFLIGIICGGLKSKFFTDYLAQGAGIKKEYRNQEYRIKDPNSLSSDYSFGAFDSDNVFSKIKMSELGDMWGTGLFKANACDFCDDVTTELADISLGDAWLDEYRKEGLGNSIIITRSEIADLIIREGILNRELEVKSVSKDLIVASQKGSFLHRQNAIAYRTKFVKLPLNKRFDKKISLSYKAVQQIRRVTRAKSINIWRTYPKFDTFNKNIFPYLFTLKVVTKINRKIRKNE